MKWMQCLIGKKILKQNTKILNPLLNCWRFFFANNFYILLEWNCFLVRLYHSFALLHLVIELCDWFGIKINATIAMIMVQIWEIIVDWLVRLIFRSFRPFLSFFFVSCSLGRYLFWDSLSKQLNCPWSHRIATKSKEIAIEAL